MTTIITRTDLVERLRQLRGATFVTIVAEVDPRLRKQLNGLPNPWPNAYKRSWVNGVVNWHYGNSVNRQRDREGQPLDHDGDVQNFDPAPRKWGHRIVRPDGLTPFVEHKGLLYLELKVERSLGHEYRDGDAVLSQEVVDPWLLKRGDEGKRQQVDKPIILRDYRIDHIREITLQGEALLVVE